ncbi:iron-containing alcohol dehydrogenase [Bacillus licheniformis]|uniref:iron-containing alcohol dehydrogenase n=1 Tax=Bacillus licheniformis TaxID=1402 RepID=UPI0021171675|nr:iron-containing alcohol dehydrogenase [Bacillus licheniformis]MEC2291406.1 iron-containing alcohol dehydrogenase [Bacillus licheniformis]MEC5249700.1 iron-containing alcohol dehydrogenase [Bacillus licheniformis]
MVAGEHSIRRLKDHVRTIVPKADRALIITQPSIVKLGAIGEVQAQLTEIGIQSDVCTAILPEPTVQNIEDVFRGIREKRYDILIGIGGGSVLDGTKILSVLQTNSKKVEELLGTDLVEKPGIPTVLIPSTSGTGAEVTPNAIVTLPEEELKVGIVSPLLLPKLVILDPVITLGLPKPITAATGMDAFTHSLESFISTKANPISDMFALESIRLISASIVEAYENGSSIQARENMLLGSTYGGMALTAAGTAAVHALAYPLGGKYRISHGVANSMLLPHVMEFNMDAITERLSLAAETMGIVASDLTAEQAAEAVVQKIREWTERLNIPQDLKAFGVTASDVDDLADSASKVTRLLHNNPKPLSLENIKDIYRKLIN